MCQEQPKGDDVTPRHVLIQCSELVGQLVARLADDLEQTLGRTDAERTRDEVPMTNFTFVLRLRHVSGVPGRPATVNMC